VYQGISAPDTDAASPLFNPRLAHYFAALYLCIRCILNFQTSLYLFHCIIYDLLVLMSYTSLTDQEEAVYKDSCWRYNSIWAVSLSTKHPSSISYLPFISKIPADYFLVLI
jgi:hypothetical protein